MILLIEFLMFWSYFNSFIPLPPFGHLPRNWGRLNSFRQCIRTATSLKEGGGKAFVGLRGNKYPLVKPNRLNFSLFTFISSLRLYPPPIAVLSSKITKFFKKFAILDKMEHLGHTSNCTICGEKEKASVNRNLHSQISPSVAFDAVK